MGFAIRGRIWYDNPVFEAPKEESMRKILFSLLTVFLIFFVSASLAEEAITPAYRSTYRPGHEACYWCTPMDIHDEEAVWAMLTAPITVVDAGQREQVILYAEPNKNSEQLGVITGASQAVHVLERNNDGWALVETYSSSFHDNKEIN